MNTKYSSIQQRTKWSIKRKIVDFEAKKEKQDLQINTVVKQSTPRIVLYINDTRQIHKDDFTFREENLSGKRKGDILEKRILCKELEWNKYELLAEKCLLIHQKLYHHNQQYKENCKSI